MEHDVYLETIAAKVTELTTNTLTARRQNYFVNKVEYDPNFADSTPQLCNDVYENMKSATSYEVFLNGFKFLDRVTTVQEKNLEQHTDPIIKRVEQQNIENNRWKLLEIANEMCQHKSALGSFASEYKKKHTFSNQ